MHVIQGSDAHRLNRDPHRETNLGACDRMTEVLVPDGSLTFDMLMQLFRSNDFNRVRPFRPSQDPYDFIRTARSEGETIVQAFHESPPARRGRLSPIVRDVAALANANGGTVFVGLSANPKDPVAGVENAGALVETIRDDVARHIVPPLGVTIDAATTGDKQVLVIAVPAGIEKPYAVAPGTIYVRQEGESTTALRDEIVQLVKAGLQLTGGLPELVPLPANPAAAELEPASAAAPLEAEPKTRRTRRRRAPQAQSAELPAELDAGETATESITAAAVPPADTEAADPAIPYPRTGVEIVASEDRDGVTYHAMRDLRNLKVVHNVTRDSARRLWRYAITQREQQACQPEQVAWQGERGFWKAYKPRGGERRYNLCYRHNGDMHVFYGVTDEGMDEDWRDLIPLAVANPSPLAGEVETETAEPTLEAGSVDSF